MEPHSTSQQCHTDATAWGGEGSRACPWHSSCPAATLWMPTLPLCPAALSCRPLPLWFAALQLQGQLFPWSLSPPQPSQPRGHAPLPSCAQRRPGNATCAIRAAWVRPRYHGRAQSWLRGSFVQREAQAGGETAWAASAQPCSGCRAQLPAWVGGGRGRCEDTAPRGTTPAPGVLPCTRGTGALPSPHIDLPTLPCLPPPPAASSFLLCQPSSAFSLAAADPGRQDYWNRGVQSSFGGHAAPEPGVCARVFGERAGSSRRRPSPPPCPQPLRPGPARRSCRRVRGPGARC